MLGFSVLNIHAPKGYASVSLLLRVCVCSQVFFPCGRPAAVMAECVCLLSSSLSGGTTPPHLRSKWILTKA